MKDLSGRQMPRAESRYHMLKLCCAGWTGYVAVLAGGLLVSHLLPGDMNPEATRPPLAIPAVASR